MMLLAQERANDVDVVAVKAERNINYVLGINQVLYDIYCSKRVGASEVAKKLGVVSGELTEETNKLLAEAERLNKECKRYYNDIATLKDIYTDQSKPIAQRISAIVDGALEASGNAENACVRVRLAASKVAEERDESKSFVASLVKRDAKAAQA